MVPYRIQRLVQSFDAILVNRTMKQLPTADDAGQCNEANSARFEVVVPSSAGEENTCAREVENLAEVCTQTFGWRRFSDDLYIGTRGTVAPSWIFDGESFIQVKYLRRGSLDI